MTTPAKLPSGPLIRRDRVSDHLPVTRLTIGGPMNRPASARSRWVMKYSRSATENGLVKGSLEVATSSPRASTM